jgi:hypothetical protein
MITYVLTTETPEGDDVEVHGVYPTDAAARAAAEADYVAVLKGLGVSDEDIAAEPLEWDVNPCYGDADIGFAGNGGSLCGYRVRVVTQA